MKLEQMNDHHRAAYASAVALAYMQAPDGTDEELVLAEVLNLASARIGVDSEELCAVVERVRLLESLEKESR